MTKLLDLVGRNIFPFEVFRAHFSETISKKFFDNFATFYNQTVLFLFRKP